jgi:16S rRNA (uracil1498-N3)-methyltransferase
MYQFYVPKAPSETVLSAEDSKHALRVLRLKVGAQVLVANGAGQRWVAQLQNEDLGGVRLHNLILDSNIWTDQYELHLLLAPPSHPDRLEWCVEKCVELGARQITLLNAARLEYPKIKQERLDKVALAAFKQCQRVWLPSITPLISWDAAMAQYQSFDHKLIAWLGSDTKELANLPIKQGRVVVMIGPEGDFTDQEVNSALVHGFIPIRLGPARLRTETAAMAVCAQIGLMTLQP